MVTLLAVYNSEGCVGRCDARCYGADHPECECICGGANHGAGLDQAQANVTEAFEQMLEDYKKDHEFNEIEIPAIYQARTRTAVHIAREINKLAGYNAVTDIERCKDVRGKLAWRVSSKSKDGMGYASQVFSNSQQAIANWKPMTVYASSSVLEPLF